MDPDTDLGRRNQSVSMRDCGSVAGFTPKVGSGLGFEPDSGIRKKEVEFWERREQFSKLKTSLRFALFLCDCLVSYVVPDLASIGSPGSSVADPGWLSRIQVIRSDFFISDPGRQDPDPEGSKMHRIWDPDPQHCLILYCKRIQEGKNRKG